MPLTPYEKKELQWWSFISAYKRYKRDFEYLAQIIRVNYCPEWEGKQGAVKITMYEDLLGAAILNYGRWEDMQKEGRKSQMPPQVYESFASPFGKYIAEENQGLLNEPCP